jgi:hypothetical protein
MVVIEESADSFTLFHECQIDLIGQCDAIRPSDGAVSFQSSEDQICRRIFRTGLLLCFGENRNRCFASPIRDESSTMWMAQRDRHPAKPTWLNPKRTDSSDEPIQDAEIWRTLTRTVEDQ